MPTLFNKLLHEAKNKKLVPAFDTKKPDTLQVGKITENGITDIRTVSISDLEKQGGFTWSESVMIPEDIKKYVDEKLSNKVKSDKSLVPYINQFNPNLMICDMGEGIGKGVFLAPNAKKIQKGEIVGFYTGEYKSITPAASREEQFLPYGMSTGQHPLFKNEEETDGKGEIDSQNIGNIWRFAQDMPTLDELDDYQFKPGVKEQVATQNIHAQAGIYRGYPLVYYVADRDIEPEEEVGYSYKGSYWLAAESLLKIRRLLIDTKGRVIPQDKYSAMSVAVLLTSEDKKAYKYYKVSKLQLMTCLSENKPFTLHDNGIIYQLTCIELKQTFDQQCTEKEKNAFKELFSKIDIMAPIKFMKLKQRESESLSEIINEIKSKAKDDKVNGHHIQFIADVMFLIHEQKNIFEVHSTLQNSTINTTLAAALDTLLVNINFPKFYAKTQQAYDLNDLYQSFLQDYGNNQVAESFFKSLQTFCKEHDKNSPLAEVRKKIINCMKTYNETRKTRKDQLQNLPSLTQAYKPKGPLNSQSIYCTKNDTDVADKSESNQQQTSTRSTPM